MSSVRWAGLLAVVFGMMGEVPDAHAREAIGTAPVVAGDEATARRRAVDEALRQLVDQTVAELVPGPERVRAEAVITAKIIRRARAYVSRHVVAEERVEPTGSVVVRIDGEVAREALVRDLVALGIQVPGAAPTVMPPAARPRVLVGVAGPAGAAVSEALAGAGLAAESAPVALTDDGGAVEAAKAVRASAAVSGIVTDGVPEALRGTGLTAVSVEVSARALDAATGRLLGEGRATEVGWGATPADAIERAARRAGSKVGAAIARALRPAASGPTLEISVAGVSRWADVAEVIRVATQLPEVAAIIPSRLGVHAATLAVRGKLTAQTLAAALGRGLGPQVIVSVRGGRVVVDRVAGGAQGEGPGGTP